MADANVAPLLGERKKKEKTHPDDTTSYEGDDANIDPKDNWEKHEDEEDKVARRERRQAY